jgi:hypothetical protein
MTVSRWERGLLTPSADYYIALGNLAGKEECWFFWERAGLNSADVVRSLPARLKRKLPESEAPELESVTAGMGGRRIGKTKLIPIPMLRAVAGTLGVEGDKTLSLDAIPATRLVGTPQEWCPNPAYTSLLRVRGHSMEPMIRDGAIVAVDSSHTADAELHGKVIVVSNEVKGLCVSRLSRYGTVSVLQPENRAYDSVVLEKKSQWRILGKVLWWITEAP